MLLKSLTLAIFLLCLCAGLHLARHNPLENDEIYSQLYGIERLSFGEILTGKIAEGNNSPLFYLSQKTFFALTRFHLNNSWVPGDSMCDLHAQTIMRFLPIVYMSAALCLLWYFFARRYGWTAGGLALLLGLASPMVWPYWAQARPYSLWTLLTTCQLLLFLSGLEKPSQQKERWLLCVHGCLCLTTAFGLIQTIIVTALLRPRNAWQAGVPLLLGLFYAWRAPHYEFHVGQAGQLILENFSLIRLAAAVLCAAGIFYLNRQTRAQWPQVKFLWAVTIFLLVPVFIIGYYQDLNVPSNVGFGLSSRYFIFLTPLATISFLVVWQNLWQRSANAWIKIVLIEIMAGALIFDGMQTWVVLQRLWG